MPADIYQLKVTLLGAKPPIWRRLLVPATISLGELHFILQIAMGWENCHLFRFTIGRHELDPPDDEESSPAGPPLRELLRRVGAKATYEYDFGDGWLHEIVVEKALGREPGNVYPVCITGKRRCPPEDCGGPPGYFNLLRAVSDPAHPEHDDVVQWLGEEFDPEEFAMDAVNKRLALMAKR